MAGAVASVFGNLLVPGVPPRDHNFIWSGVEEEEVREGQENGLLCVREEA